MNKRSLVLALSVVTTSALASNVIIESQLLVKDPQKKYLQVLLADPSVIIDHVNSEGYEIYGSSLLPQILATSGIPFTEMPEAPLKALLEYPTFEQMKAHLEAIQKAHPHLMKLFSIGKSSQGRDLLVMKISNNPEVDQVKPEFKYISSMHGDEITGRELMVRLIEDLGDSYEKGDAKIRALVDSTEIFIMPSMNPDGSTAIQRANAQGIDLNRNFPELSNQGVELSTEDLAPETQAVMKWESERQFALSANFHGGAEVVNYMWDAVQELHPFDHLLYDLAIDYSKKTGYIFQSSAFQNGVTNGYAWYQVLGGMQDWSYRKYNDTQFTIELSSVKYPDYSQMDYYYQQNRPALLSFMAKIHQGGGFSLNKPGVNGEVQIVDAQGKDLGTYHFRNSEFYKVLEPGDYRLEVHPEGMSASTVDIHVAPVND